MKLLYQFGIIMFVTFLGEFLHCLIPLPIPASIYGLLLMLAGLMTKVIKLEQVKIAADFLIEIMPPMFIPAAVGLIVTWSDLKAILVPVLVDHLYHDRLCYGCDRKNGTGSNASEVKHGSTEDGEAGLIR